MSNPLSQLEIDGIKSLLESDDLDEETTGELLTALGRAVAEIEERRADERMRKMHVGETGNGTGEASNLSEEPRRPKFAGITKEAVDSWLIDRCGHFPQCALVLNPMFDCDCGAKEEP